MKKLLLLAAFLLLLVPKEAFALSCEVSHALFGGERCWTSVKLTSGETSLVSEGHVLVYHIDANTPKQGAYEVRLATGSSDGTFVAGVAQGRIATGESALILVRGFGEILTVGGITTGDLLYVTASGNAGHVSTDFSAIGGTGSQASLTPVAIAYETSTTNGTDTRSAFIRVL